MSRFLKSIIGLLPVFLCFACQPGVPKDYVECQDAPAIYPDYRDVTIPPNIAPLRFVVDEKADAYVVRIAYPDGQWVTDQREVKPDVDEWHHMLETAKGRSMDVEVYVKHGEEWTRRRPFRIQVAQEPIDPYLSYRLISPSYVTYKDLSLNQRNLSDFKESIIYGNMMNTDARHAQCINCHAYQNYNPDRMQFHVREDMGGTVIAYDGKVSKVNTRADSLLSAGVYPAWHPTEPLIAYSVNQTGQTFHTLDLQKVEVQDMASDLILYDVKKNEVKRIPGDADEMEVFPWWSPDGRYLYYASAHFVRRDTTARNLDKETIQRYKEIKYNLYRRSYDPKRHAIGPAELVFDAAALGKSATLPRISPDGHYLMFTLGGFGVFHIWHKDADLYLMDLRNRQVRPMTEFNSDDVESYHSWSSHGRWVVFSSRRDDGNYT
ncbi:MAG: hypothetical protein LUC45_00040, partial [Paraprevotella sp.]|nr:hypothetical protein [Paraprevotella sp.]